MTNVTSKSSSNKPKSFGRPPAKDMVWTPGDTFEMGSDHYYPEEAPAHRVTVDGFWIDKYAVTNEQFQKFVKRHFYSDWASGRTQFGRARPRKQNGSGLVHRLPPPWHCHCPDRLPGAKVGDRRDRPLAIAEPTKGA